ncbi:MAG: 3'-5' exonuclease [Rikenellaceae bacterium]
MSQEIEQRISNEQTAALPALTFGGQIVVVEREEQVESACRDLMSHPIIGFDTETRPSFKAGVSYKVSLLQLSTPERCYLIRLNKVGLSRPILEVLESDKVVKLGADVAGDIRSLNQICTLHERGFYDLQNVVWEWGIAERSLRKMAALVLGSKISKAQRLSNWEAATFTPQQMIYAATDAWACIEIYNKLQSTPKLSAEQIAKLRAQQAQQAAEAAERRRKRMAEAEAKGYKRPSRPSRPSRHRRSKKKQETNE